MSNASPVLGGVCVHGVSLSRHCVQCEKETTEERVQSGAGGAVSCPWYGRQIGIIGGAS